MQDITAISGLLCSTENFTRYENLGCEPTGLVYAIALGYLKQLCRTRSLQGTNNLIHQVNWVTAQTTDANLKKFLIWLTELLEGVATGCLKATDPLLRSLELKMLLVRLVVEGVIRQDWLTFDKFMNSGLGRLDKTLISKIGQFLQAEICIYWIDNHSEYTRFEHLCSSSEGLVVDVYQIGGRDGIETGLLLHRELVQLDSLQVVSTSCFPFVCTPVGEHGRMTETACSHSRAVPRHSQTNLIGPEVSRPSTGVNHFIFDEQEGPPNKQSQFLHYSQVDPHKPVASHHQASSNPFEPKYNIGHPPPTPIAAVLKPAGVVIVCMVCLCSKQREEMYFEVACPNICTVCNECMCLRGLPTRLCPRCNRRDLSDAEVAALTLLYRSYFRAAPFT
jgi:hypothetical protein